MSINLAPKYRILGCLDPIPSPCVRLFSSEYYKKMMEKDNLLIGAIMADVAVLLSASL